MLPLEGIKIISVEQYGAGPFGTLYLADLGADVIKIENPHDGGDIGRNIGPHFFGPGDSHFYQTFNRNKRSLTLDLKHPEGQQVLHDLVAKSDAVLNNLRGDLPNKLGLDFQRLKEFNPAIVCTHLSSYGRTGSRAGWPGYDYLMQAETGYLSVTGEPGSTPARCGLSIVDWMTGLAAAFSLVSGVLNARATGEGRDLDVNLFDVSLFNLSYLATWYLNEGYVQGQAPRSSHPSLTPSQLFRTKDGWIFIMCNKEKFWPTLAETVGKPEWIDDPRFKSFAARLKNRDLLTEMLDDVLSERGTADWLEKLEGKIPVAPINDVGQALEAPFVKDRGRIVDVPHDTQGAIRMLASPISCSDGDIKYRAAPKMGADADNILREAGYDESRIEKLRKANVI
ncbi:MAG: CoA transferase [Rhodospirillaceae bacterium]|jgi:crotonobetainyl-CoA:carnitine CoA-transferase CaiB-like acyl-CoA transferase|nr:CoA transferase [Rhodospirillaceae bacterium]